VGELSTYRRMRDFSRTPEPAGDNTRTAAEAEAPRFVVQEHHATALHWDVRLERDGVLVSWAVPKGLPPDPRVDHLAVHTEDHPMSYLDFEGEIPEGEYGGGTVILWDTGTYECEKWQDREVIVVLHGDRARGRYAFFRTNGRNWMVHRMDPPEDPTRELLPDRFAPAPPKVQAGLPRDPAAWAFEPAWGGSPVVVVSQGGRLRIHDAEGEDITKSAKDLSGMGRAIGIVEVAVEGELVKPAAFLASDLVWLEGHPTTSLPFRDRRSLLDRLDLSGPNWGTAPSHPGEGETLLAAARDQGLPGVRARRLDGPYESPLFVPA
jgi:DNA ligase D-like protein (predicted 3'-phosphoesterase)